MRKPKSTKKLNLRNLTVYGGFIYYERVVTGRRYRVNTKARPNEENGWEDAAKFRDLYEERKGINREPLTTGRMPTFAEMAKAFLEKDTADYSTRHRGALKGYLRENGPILGPLGTRPLDEITPGVLREWWGWLRQPQKDEKGNEWQRSLQTARHHLDVISSVYGYAIEAEKIESDRDPVPAQIVSGLYP